MNKKQKAFTYNDDLTKIEIIEVENLEDLENYNNYFLLNKSLIKQLKEQIKKLKTEE